MLLRRAHEHSAMFISRPIAADLRPALGPWPRQCMFFVKNPVGQPRRDGMDLIGVNVFKSETAGKTRPSRPGLSFSKRERHCRSFIIS